MPSTGLPSSRTSTCTLAPSATATFDVKLAPAATVCETPLIENIPASSPVFVTVTSRPLGAQVWLTAAAGC